jgi:tetratricopeptide (TPR) repeat protein
MSFPESTETLPLLDESIALYREMNDKLDLCTALFYYGYRLVRIGELAHAYSTAEESLLIAQEIGSVTMLATAQFSLGHVTVYQGKNTLALSHLEKSLTLFKQAGNKLCEPWVLDLIGCGLFDLGQYDRAKTQTQRSLALWMAMGNSANAAGSKVFLAAIAWHQDHLSEVKAHCVDSLLLSRETEIHDYNVARSLLFIAMVTDIEQNPKRVATLIGYAEKFWNKLSFTIDPFNVQVEIDRIVETLHTYVNKETLDAAYARGSAMTRKQAIDFALSEFSTE